MRSTLWMTGAIALAACLGHGLPSGVAQEQEQEAQQEQREQQEQEEENEQKQREQTQREEEQARQEQQRQQEQENQQREEREPAAQERQQEAERREQEARERERDARERSRDQQRRLGGERESLQQQGRTRQGMELGARLEDYGDRLVISEVQDQSLAAQAGLQEGDRIVAVDGRTVRTSDQLREILNAASGQRRVPMVIIRDDQRQTVYLDVGRNLRGEVRSPEDRQYGGDEAWLGVILDARYEDFAVVQRVYPGSAADQAGIREGDWIIGVNNRRVQSPAHLAQIISNMRPGERIDIRVARRVARDLQARLGDMGERYEEDRFAGRRREDRFERRFDQRFGAEEDLRSGYRGIDESDVYEELEDDQQDQDLQEQGRRRLRDRFDFDREEGDRSFRGRLEDLRDRVEDFRDE